jgi:hypothetical protein
LSRAQDGFHGEPTTLIAGIPLNSPFVRTDQPDRNYALLIARHEFFFPLKPVAARKCSRLNPLTIAHEAIKAVPVLKYALGVLGIVSLIAVFNAFKVDLRIAVFGQAEGSSDFAIRRINAA